MPSNSHQQPSSTYIAHNRIGKEELTRLHIQNQQILSKMGGVLSEQPDPMRFHRILDVGCGTGDWLIDLARTNPNASQLIGIDANEQMITYAKGLASDQGVADRVQFHLMDAMNALEFPADSFDLINQHLGSSFLRTWDWSSLLSEFLRITQAGGVIRVTESVSTESTSPTMMRINSLLLQALYQSGHRSGEEGEEIVDELERAFRQFGLEDIQTHIWSLMYHGGTAEGQTYSENMGRAFRTFQSFILKWVRLQDDYEALYKQALYEMQRQDFVATWNLCTVWGTKR